MLSALVLLSAQTPWPSFRGPGRDGRAPDARLSEAFDPDLDRLWRRELEPGHSSPVLAGDGVFFTVVREGRVHTVCRAATDGRTLWESAGPADAPAEEGAGVDPALLAASTPVTDGRAIFVSYPAHGLVAYELTGEERWRLPLGALHAPYPPASSPAWADGRIVHLCDHDRGSFLIAVDTGSGEVLWRAERPFATHGFSSPVVVDGVVVVSGSLRVDAYGLADGRHLWSMHGTSWQPRATPVAGEGIVYVQSAVRTVRELGLRVVSETWQEALDAWDADVDRRLTPAELADARVPGEWSLHDLDGDGALGAIEWEQIRLRARSGSGLWALRLVGGTAATPERTLWTRRRGVPLSATPILVDGVLVTVRDGGLVLGLDARSGEERWATRVDSMRGNVFSSPVSIGGRVVTLDTDGVLAILDPRDGRVVETHELGEGVWATPAIGGGRLFVRTTEALHAFRLEDPGVPRTADVRAFVGVDVCTMGERGYVRDRTLVLRGERITALGPRATTPVPPGAHVVARGPGLTVLPGLIDAWARVEDEGELVRHLLAGVTTIRTPDGRPELLELRARVRAGEVPGPGWVIGGPALGAEVSAADAARAVDGAAAAGYDFACAEVGLSPESWLAAATRARELGLPFAGVPPPGLGVEEVLACEPWTLDRLEALIGEPDLAPALVRAGVPITPLVAAHSMWIEATARRGTWIDEPTHVEGVSPVVRMLWSPAAHVFWRGLDRRDVRAQSRSRRAQRERLAILDEAGVELLAGSDAIASFVHPGVGLHRELSVLSAAGLSPERTLRAATSAPGRVLARVLDEPRGTLRVGGPADLILVTGDPLVDPSVVERPAGSMVAGRWYRRGTLEGSLAEFEAAYLREAEFVDAVAARRSEGTAGLIEYLGRPEIRALDLRESTARRMIELLLHRHVRRVEDAAAVRAFVDERWPAGQRGGAEEGR